MTLYQVLRELQLVLALILGACPLCCQPLTLDRLAAALAGTYQSTTKSLSGYSGGVEPM
jgi:hypothetical protein